MAGLKRYSQLTSKDVYSCTEKSAFSRTDFRELAFANRLARHNIEQILSGILQHRNYNWLRCSQGFCFASSISLNDMNDMRIAGRELTHAVRKRRATVLKFLIKLSC